MLTYTNILTQCAKSIDSIVSHVNTNKRKVKYIHIIAYILCIITAVLVANNYFEKVNGLKKNLLLILAGIFNIPFLFYYAVWYLHLNNPKPGFIN
jgi:hypothetical protein